MSMLKKGWTAVALGAALVMGGTQGMEGKQEKKEPSKKEEAKKDDKKPVTVPEITAHDWINSDKAITLAGLKGKVVLIKFFHYG